MLVTILVASCQNNTIGFENRLPWHLSDDIKNFRALTIGHTVVMGRKTFESVGKPLPKRHNIVLTQQKPARPASDLLTFAENITDAIEIAKMKGETEAFIVGGGTVYAQVWDIADKLCWTRIKADVQGDTFFLPPDMQNWRLISSQHVEANPQNDYAYDIEVWEKDKK